MMASLKVGRGKHRTPFPYSQITSFDFLLQYIVLFDFDFAFAFEATL